MHHIAMSRSTAHRFNLGVEPDVAQAIIRHAFRVEVMNRGREYMPNEMVEAKLAQWLIGKGKPWLMFMGNVGDGKSTAMRVLQAIINNAYIKVPRRDGSLGEEWRMALTWAKTIVDIIDDDSKLKGFANNLCLGIDDIGAEATEIMRYGNIVTPLADIICQRYDRQLQTIFTTNLPSKEFRKRYGERVADRLNEMVEVIVFPKDSYR